MTNRPTPRYPADEPTAAETADGGKAVPDVYATIAEADSVVEVLAEVLELRAGDPQQQAIRDAYLSTVEFPPDARVLEVGCGPGPVARALAVRPGVGEVVGSIRPPDSWSWPGNASATSPISPSSKATPERFRRRRIVRRRRLPHRALPRPGAGGRAGRGLPRAPPGRLPRGLRRRLCDDDLRQRRPRPAPVVSRYSRGVPGPRPLDRPPPRQLVEEAGSKA